MHRIQIWIAIILTLFVSIFNKVQATDSMSFELTAASQKSNHTSWSIVAPNYLINKNSIFRLINNNGEEINATFIEAASWPSFNEELYLRSFVIFVEQQLKTNVKYKLTWTDSQQSNLSKFSKRVEINHHASYPINWLAKTHFSPILSERENKDTRWFDQAHLGYAKGVTTEKQKARLNTPSVWLYDRTLALYQLYLKTGDIQWKVAAHESATFYQEHIDEKGRFTLKNGDMKYANTQGLLLDYLFYPNSKTKENIDAIYQHTLTWPSKIKTSGFWTERHHSVALGAAISSWELNLDRQSLSRINAFLNGMSNKLLNNNNNCLDHSFASHEGWKKKTDVCSPWMTALLVQQLWRYHHLSFDFQSLEIISQFTDFLIADGSYIHAFKKVPTAIPKYLSYMALSLSEKQAPFSDFQHACDVADSIAKGVYAKQMFKLEHNLPKKTLKDMLRACYRSMYRRHGDKAWRIAPTRKFNWWYANTASFTWLLDRHGISYTPDFIP